MMANQIIDLRAKLEKLVADNHDLLGDEHLNLTRKHGIDRVDDLEKAFNKIDEDERLLQIGVIGRVKAGKSSLLNALLFDGEAVLPKAATPMTAALTRLSWGPSLSAEVEFYSEADLDNIRSNVKIYEAQRDDLASKQLAALRKRRDASATPGESDEELLQRARRSAERALSDRPALSAAYDQYARIQNAGLNPRALGERQVLEANDLSTLRQKLQDYAGVNGYFMPVTKSVHIRMPLEKLRDIEIVDTPGLNDPVASREERTCELLKYCDVIFIVSPAGQFFSRDDLDLMGRVTHKEGIRELYVLASQVDTQLFGSNHAAGRLDAALRSISTELGAHAQEALRAFKRDNPEVGATFDKLIDNTTDNLLHTSGISHALRDRFAQRGSWDDGETKVWENLSAHFPEYFPADNDGVALANLDKLANIATLHTVILDVRAKKDAIKAERQQTLAVAKRDALLAYRSDLLSYVTDRRRRVDDADIGKLQEQRGRLEEQREVLSDVLETEFRNELHKFTSELDRELNAAVAQAFMAIRTTLENDQGSHTGSYSTETTGIGGWLARKLSFGGYTTHTYTETTVLTSNVSNQLIAIADRIQASVDRVVKDKMKSWEEALRRALFAALRDNLPEDQIDGYLERRAIRNLVDDLKRPSLKTDLELPASLRPQGKLQGASADEYIEAALNHIGDLERRFERGVKRYIDDTDELKYTDIASLFLAGYGKQVESLEDEIQNKRLVTERLARLLTELNLVTQ